MNAFLLMQQHLMLQIFVSDAWLALWIFLDFLPKSLWNDSARREQYATHVLFSHSTEEKEFFIHVVEICCQSGIFIKRYLTEDLKAENYLAIHFLRKWFVFELLFQSRIVDASSYVAMTSWQIMRHQQKLKKFA